MAGTPNTTLYINNLNDKVNKDELRHQLFSLFMTYGKVLDVVAQKGPKRRGQAFLVFADLAEATAAMRACEGFIFYDKPMVCNMCVLLYRIRSLCRIAHPICKNEIVRNASERRPGLCASQSCRPSAEATDRHTTQRRREALKRRR